MVTRRAAAAAILALIAATTAVAFLSRATGPLGFQATVIRADRPAADAVLVSHGSLLTWQSAQRLIDAAGGGSVRMRWDGYLHAPQTREYEIRVVSDAPVILWIDGRAIFESSGSPDPPARTLSLTAGPHLVGLAYGPVTRSTALDIQWDVGNRFRLASLPLEGLSPRPLPGWKWRVRAYVPSAALAVTTAWSLVMLLAAWLWTWRVAGKHLEADRQLRLTLGGLFVLFVTGIWWGGIGGWQADAIDPESVRTAVLRRFGDGWYDKYPPLHYYLLGILYLPTIAADGLGWLTVHSEPVQLAMTLTGRLLTVLMGLGTTLAVAIVAARLTDRRHAWPAALLCGAFLPFAFYAKTTNVDLPFVCWFAWSLVFLVALLETTSVRDAVFLGITAGAAVGTKDQAYGLYILPALLLLWRFGRSLAGWKILASGALAAAVALLLIYNVLLNPEGLSLHLEFIQGPASTGYRMFEPSAAGQRDLLKSSAGQLLFTTGIAGALLILAGIGSRHYSRSRFAFVMLAGSMLSYYLGFIAYAGYVYDRFLLPLTCVLAVFASIGARRLLDSGPAPRIAGIVLLGWVVARATAIDVLLVRDSRVTAERWLEAHVKKNEVVAAVNQYGYIPRLFDFKRTWIQPSIEYTLAVNPDYVVLNREHSGRAAPGSDEQQWLAWLESGTSPYQEVFRYKASLAWTPLALDDRFSDRLQDPFTNLDKANPEIVIFRKTR